MKNKDFDKLKVSVKEGGKMLSWVSDERLQELIDMYEWYVSNVDVRTAEFAEFEDILSTLKDYKLLRQREDADKHTLLDSDLLQTIDGLRTELKIMTEYADKLAEPLDYLPKDIENIRKANLRLHAVEAQNKLLIEDGDRLADFLNREVGVYEGGNSFKCVFCGEANGVHPSDCPFGKIMDKHEELKAQIEPKV